MKPQVIWILSHNISHEKYTAATDGSIINIYTHQQVILGFVALVGKVWVILYSIVEKKTAIYGECTVFRLLAEVTWPSCAVTLKIHGLMVRYERQLGPIWLLS